MIRTSNKSTFVLKNKFHLSIRHNMLWEIFEIKSLGFFFFFNTFLFKKQDTSTQQGKYKILRGKRENKTQEQYNNTIIILFTREEIIVRSEFICKFSFTERRVKVSSFQGQNQVNLFLVMTCSIYKKHELKIFKCVSNTGILTKFNYKLCRTDNNLISLRRNVPSLLVQFLQQVSHNKY